MFYRALFAALSLALAAGAASADLATVESTTISDPTTTELSTNNSTGDAVLENVTNVVTTSYGNSSHPLVGVNTTGNATGELVAVSGYGNASCTGGLCFAVSGFGNATTDLACDYATLGPFVVNLCAWGFAVSGFGNATGYDTAVSVMGNATGGVTAVSVFGNATACQDYQDCVAVSGTGDAKAYRTFSGCKTLGTCFRPPSLAP